MSGRKSILVKLVLIMLLISIITGGIILSVALNEQRLSLENNLIEENKRFAQVAARSIEAGYVEQSWPFRTLSQMNDSEEVLFWWIVEPDGTIHLADDHAMCGKIVDFKSFETEEEAVVKDYVYRGEDIKFLVQPLRIGEPGKVWYLCIGISLKSVSAAANRVIITSLCYFSLIIAFAGGLAFLFARRFTKPILQLVEGTKAISKGDFDAKVEIKTGDEIEGLGDAFNKMAEQIKSSFALEKAAREELQKSEEKYRSLVESTEDIVYLVTKDCRYIFVNDKYLSRFGGLPIHRVIDRAYGEFHSSEETKQFAEIVVQVFETGKSIQSEHRSLRDSRYFLQTLSPVKDSEGRTTAVTVISKDITERKRVEEALKKEKATLNNIINLNPYSIQICDKDGYHIRANQAFMDLFNTIPPREWSIFNDSLLKKAGHQGLIRKVKSGEVVQVPETWYNPHDISPELPDKRECISSVNFPILNPDGAVENIVIMHENVTERKQAEEKLRLFSQSVESSVDGIAMGEQGRITYVNEAFATMLGYSKDELIGKEIAFIYAEDQRPKLEEAVKATMEGSWTGELVGKRKNDELFPLAISASRVVDDKGKVIAIMASHRDITERKQAEEALRKSEERFRAIFETAQDSIFIKDRALKYTLVNPTMEKLFGLPASKIIGKTDDDLFDKEAASHIREVDSRVLKGEIVEEEHTKKIKGVQFSFHIIKVPLRDDSGEIIGVCGIARDITERKRAEKVLRESHEKLKELDQMKTDFLTVAYHEMGNPLTPIVGYIHLLERSKLSEKQKRYVSIIAESATQLGELIGSLLEVTRIDAGKVELTLEPISIPEIVKSVLERIQPQADAKQQTISSVVPEGIEVEGDKQKITAIFDNLISNAIKYTREKGGINIVVEDRKEQEDIRVCVADTGIGIPKEQLPRVFERFYMVDTSLTRKGGLGLGLTIVKGYVKLHGGKVWVTSKFGKGSKFCFTVPKKQKL